MSVQLLDKTRKINKLLHNNHSTKVVFNDICEVLMETLSSNILVISKKGKVLGISLCPGVEEITELIEDKVGGYVDAALNERLLGVLSTKENVNLQTLGFERPGVERYTAIICPIEIAGERLGTVFMYRCTPQYDIDDIIVSEYGTTVVGLEMMRSVNEENVEENRKVQVVKSAFNTLSFSELEAIIHIFDELNGDEGILVASKIADRVGITRSVIVNALRKFESAGVIESRSSGMKGRTFRLGRHWENASHPALLRRFSLRPRPAQSSILRGTGLALKRDMGSRSLIDIASILGWGFARRIRVFASRTRAGFGRLSASSPARYKRSAFA